MVTIQLHIALEIQAPLEEQNLLDKPIFWSF